MSPSEVVRMMVGEWKTWKHKTIQIYETNPNKKQIVTVVQQ